MVENRVSETVAQLKQEMEDHERTLRGEMKQQMEAYMREDMRRQMEAFMRDYPHQHHPPPSG